MYYLKVGDKYILLKIELTLPYNEKFVNLPKDVILNYVDINKMKIILDNFPFTIKYMKNNLYRKVGNTNYYDKVYEN